MPFLIGKKVKMEQQWDESNKVVPVTLIQAGPVTVTQAKTTQKDGYIAFQVGYHNTKKKVSKALAGHLKQNGPFAFMREFKPTDPEEHYDVGTTIDVSTFNPGDRVTIVSLGKGRGFQGVVKRHGFSGGPKTHGQKDRHRAPGSIGVAGQQRVSPGKKMAGRMGQNRVTRHNVSVLSVDTDKNIIAVKGPVAGNARSLVLIQK
jgi:large subunit ribosomal protein L3